MIVDKGSRELVARMKKDVAKMKTNLEQTHQRLVLSMFRDLVAHTPQWSGELAMHWSIEVHGAKAPAAYTYVSNLSRGKSYTEGLTVEPYRMGADPAVSSTIARELPKIREIKYNSIVKFVNNTPYAYEVEKGLDAKGKPLRDVNLTTAIMRNYLDMKYKNLRVYKKAAGL